MILQKVKAKQRPDPAEAAVIAQPDLVGQVAPEPVTAAVGAMEQVTAVDAVALRELEEARTHRPADPAEMRGLLPVDPQTEMNASET